MRSRVLQILRTPARRKARRKSREGEAHLPTRAATRTARASPPARARCATHHLGSVHAVKHGVVVHLGARSGGRTRKKHAQKTPRGHVGATWGAVSDHVTARGVDGWTRGGVRVGGKRNRMRGRGGGGGGGGGVGRGAGVLAGEPRTRSAGPAALAGEPSTRETGAAALACKPSACEAMSDAIVYPRTSDECLCVCVCVSHTHTHTLPDRVHKATRIVEDLRTRTHQTGRNESARALSLTSAITSHASRCRRNVPLTWYLPMWNACLSSTSATHS